MKTTNKKYLHLTLALMMTTAGLTGCGIVSEVINHEANDQRLLKPGALDLPINQTYRSYKYVFLDKYKVTHDWVFVGSCSYGSVEDVSGKTIYTGNIFEKDERTYVDRESSAYPKDSRYKYGIKNLDITKYTRPEWRMGPNGDGKYVTVEGFHSMCFETWQGTQHFLSISLNKRKLDVPNIYGFKDGVISHQTIGNNHWDIQKFDYQPYAINSAGRLVESWVLPIADTGYTFIFEFGANLDSLQHPQAHAQMQAIFKHLIESVKIEPIKP